MEQRHGDGNGRHRDAGDARQAIERALLGLDIGLGLLDLVFGNRKRLSARGRLRHVRHSPLASLSRPRQKASTGLRRRHTRRKSPDGTRRRCLQAGQRSGPPDQRFDHRLRLLRNQRVARARDDRDGDPVAELVLHLVALLRRLERIAFGLQVEQRRNAGGPPVGLLDRGGRRALAFAHLRVPAVQPFRWIVARREKGKPQGLKTLLVGQRRIARHIDRGQQFGRKLLGRGGKDDHAAHQRRMIDRRHPRDPVAVGVTDDHGLARAKRLDHLGDIAREIVQRNAGQRPGALADAARLRTQRAIARRCKTFRDRVVVLGIARERRQQDDGRSLPFDDDFDCNVGVAHELPRAHAAHASPAAFLPSAACAAASRAIGTRNGEQDT